MREGTVIAERYAIERLAGAGAMGSVYRARDRVTGGPVAVKVVRQPVREAALRFEREAQVLSRLRHPAIVGYIEHGRTGDDMFLVMQWLEGESLSERLSAKGLSLEESVALCRRIASALGAAHAAGVVHRDVKPSNVFLPGGAPREAMLVDFGIAHLGAGGADLTRTGAMIGTPAFASPEQARGERSAGAASDVFSLGSVLYKCLVGRSPFVSDDVYDLLIKVVTQPVTPPSALRPRLPDDLERLVLRMLAKSPADRPPSGSAVVAEIDALAPLAGALSAPRARGPILAEGDRRLLCLVALATRSADTATIEDIAAGQRARVRSLGDGEWAISIGEAGSSQTEGKTTAERTLAPTDVAGRAARCALALEAVVPSGRIAIASGRFAGEDDFPGALVRAAIGLMDADLGAPIRIDDVTASLLDARFEVTKEGQRLALTGEREGSEAGRTLLGRATPCVGREQELTALEAAITASVEEQAARAVLVLGAAGMGKSRLRAELLRRMRQRDSAVAVWSGGADEMGQNAAFSLVGSALRRLLGVAQAPGSGEELRSAIDRRFEEEKGWSAAADKRRAALRDSPEERLRLTEMLGVIAGIEPPGEPSPRLRAAQRDARLMADHVRLAWEDFVAQECGRGPVLLVLEDIHWADAASMELVDAALRRMANGPLTVLGLARPEALDVFQSFFRSHNVQEIRLGPLSKRASERLVYNVLGGGAKPEEVTAIVDRAAGHAFYLEELIRSAAEGGNALPESIRAMLEARLATLPPLSRRIVRAASVFGQVFWKGGVRSILRDDVEEALLTEHLADLVRRELVERQARSRFPGEEELTFRHALLRDAAYAGLSDNDGTVVHALAAEWLEHAGESRGNVIGEHFERGGLPLRAVSGYVRAAEQALQANDPLSAVRWSTRAIACGASGPALGRALWLQAEGYNWHGSLADAERAALSAIPLLPRGSAAFFSAVAEAAIASARLGHMDTVLALSQDLREPAADEDASEEQVRAVAYAAIQCLLHARHSDADSLFAWLDGAVAHEVELGSKIVGPVAEACSWRALFAGDPSAYLELSRTAASAYDDIGDMRNGARARLNIGYGAMLIGDFEEAESALREALRSSERLGAAVSVIRHNLGLVLAHLGQAEEAVLMEESALAATEPVHLRLALGCELYLARIHEIAGNDAGAERHAERAIDLVAQPSIAANAFAVLAMVKLRAGLQDEANELAERAAKVLAQVERIDEGESYIRLALAEVRHASSDRKAAQTAVAAAWASLSARAAKIADPRVREGYLRRVPENARTLELAKEYGLSEATDQT